MKRGEFRLDGGKFMVAVNICDGKTTDGVEIDDPSKLFGDGRS